MDIYDMDTLEASSLDTWEYENYFKEESSINQLTRPRQTIKDIQLFKSDFNNLPDYLGYLTLKQKDEQERGIKTIKQ